jgi:hypothetical protein
MKKIDIIHSSLRKMYMKRLLSCAFCLLGWLTLVYPSKADSPWRIPNYASYVELNDGAVFCGEMYDSWHEGRTGNVCAGGQYDSWHEGRTGEVACGGQYDGWHEGRTGNVCAGGQYDGWHEDRTGEVACGGQYASFHKSATGKVCFGGLYQLGSLTNLNSGAPSREATGAAAGATRQATKLMIFGGEDHKTYLGCLDCSEHEPDSVRNKFGDNGSPYSSSSIWNHYSEYGSRYSSGGACNPYSNDPPVIVDQNGKFYGRLSLNRYHPELGIGAKLYDWLKSDVCGQ